MRLALIPSPFAVDRFGVGSGRTPQGLLDAGPVRSLEADGHDVRLAQRGDDLGVHARPQVRPHLVGLALAAINIERDPRGRTIRAAVELVRQILAA